MPGSSGPLAFWCFPLSRVTSPSSWATHGVNPHRAEDFSKSGTPASSCDITVLPASYIRWPRPRVVNQQCLSLTLLTCKLCHLPKCCGETSVPRPPGPLSHIHPSSFQHPLSTRAVFHQLLFYCLLSVRFWTYKSHKERDFCLLLCPLYPGQ